MPYDFGISSWRSIATPPFLPEDDARMPSAPPPPPALPSLDDGPDPMVPSAASRELQALLHERSQQKQPSLTRRILGTVVGGWAPGLGQDIADPGARKFQQRYNVLNEQAKLEGQDFDRRLKAEDIRDKDWNRRYLRYQAGLESQRKTEEANQRDATSRSNAGEQILTPEPYTLPGRTITAPTPERLSWPEGSGPPSLQPLDANDPASIVPSAKLPSFSGISQPKVPQGYYQVPATSYDPKNAMRVKPTQQEVARQKYEATTEETPADILKAFPDSPKRMTSQSIQGTRQAILNNDAKAAALIAAKERADELKAFQAQQNELNRQNQMAMRALAANATRPQGDTDEAVRMAGDRVLSGEITAQQAHGLLGGQRGGLGGALLKYIEGKNGRILPPKVREGINSVNMGLNQLDELEQMVNDVVNAPSPEERAKRTALLEGYSNTITARLARANGETGVLTDQDVNRAKSLLAGWKAANFAPDYAKRELGALRQSYNAVKNAYQNQYFNEVSGGGNGNNPPPVASPEKAAGTVKYLLNGKSYTIPVAEEKDFLKDNPGAKKQ